MVLFHPVEVTTILQPQAVEGANIYHVEHPARKNAQVFQVVPQITAAEAAGQVLSNSVEGRWG